MEIGKRLKEARNSMNITQEQAAEKIFVTRQTLSNWENGRSLPDIVSVIKLSELYGLSLDELLRGDVNVMKKAENDKKAQERNVRLIIFAGILAVVLGILTLAGRLLYQPLYDFMNSALPWLLMSIALACWATLSVNESEKE